jgi:cGMP-dependent protein kinase 1
VVAVEINGIQVKTMQEGAMFGDLALLYAATRSASIKVVSDKCVLMAMKAYIFKKTMQEINLKNSSKLFQIVNRVKIFSYLTNKQRHIIANNLVRRPFQKDECIFLVNEPANSFYIIEKGSVRINIPGKGDIIIN